MSRPILLVEDDLKLAEIARVYLEEAGFRVIHTESGVRALALAKTENPVLVVLDLMLPDLSGEAVCRELTESFDIPVIMLTSKSSEEERLAGFALGADDYIVKPFSPRELVCRIQAVLKRSGKVVGAGERFSFNGGKLILDTASFSVICKGQPVKLTAVEFKLLITLAATPQKTFTREELIDKVMGYQFEGYERNIDSHIKNIRHKLGEDSHSPEFVLTVYGLGYRFAGVTDA
ncbi:MAG: DNA-binding response regulator [Geobacteraceae bacterium GWB2_52_12]|nr:MAG: DNA-binding response regulator [Geobacteraceae bacterium GWB2_52_12]